MTKLKGWRLRINWRVAMPVLAVAIAAGALIHFSSLPTVNAHSGNWAHNVELSCPETIDEGDTGTITLSKASGETGRLVGDLNTDGITATGNDDYEVLDEDIDSNDSSVDIDIDVYDDDDVEGHESVDIRWGNDHDGAPDLVCRIGINDADHVKVTSMTVTSSPAEGDTYKHGETFEITTVFDQAVTTGGTAIQLELGHSYNTSDYSAHLRDASYSSGSGTDTLIFTYEIQAWDRDFDGISIRPRKHGWGSIRITSSNQRATKTNYGGQWQLEDHKANGSPTLIGAEITSSPENGEAYDLFETIELTFTFDHPITEVKHKVGHDLEIGDNTRWAVYDQDLTEAANEGVDGVQYVVLTYQVQADDFDADGITIPAVTNGNKGWRKSGSARFVVEKDIKVGKVSISAAQFHDHDAVENVAGQQVDPQPAIGVELEAQDGELGANVFLYALPDSDDLHWRADIVSGSEDADTCEGTGMGSWNAIAQSDLDDIEDGVLAKRVTIATGCSAGSYTLEVSLVETDDIANVTDEDELSSDSADFTINLSWLPSN